MTTYFSDTFTDPDGTALSAHTPDIGTSWTIPFGSDGVIESDEVTNASFAGCLAIASNPPSSADYQVSATVFANGGTGGNAYLLLRDDGSGGNHYAAGWTDSASEWQIGVVASTSFTSLGSSSTNPLTDPSSHDLIFAAVGGALSLSVDGTVLVAVTDSTYTAIGEAGLELNGLIETWLSFDTFVVEDVGGGGGGGSHPGLTGQGFIGVSSPVGVEVDLTGVPTSLGAGPGYPTPRYHIGSLGFSADAAHYSRLAFLSQSSEVFVCPFPTVTSIAYSLAPGITATITEIASW